MWADAKTNPLSRESTWLSNAATSASIQLPLVYNQTINETLSQQPQTNCDHRQQQLNIPRAEAHSLNVVTGCLREPVRWSHYLLIIPESYTDSNSTSNLQHVWAQVYVEWCGMCTWLFRVWMAESPVWGEKQFHCLARIEASGFRPHLQSGNRLEAYQVWIL